LTNISVTLYADLMNTAYRAKFLKVLGAYVVIIIILITYVTHVERTVSSENYNSFLLNPLFAYAMLPLIVAAFVCYAWAHYILAKGKGYSGWFTLLALINVIGLIILIFLPNKMRAAPDKVLDESMKQSPPKQPLSLTQIAQFLAVCSRSKWSKHLTNSPCLALLAMAGSSAACKISSACSKALC